MRFSRSGHPAVDLGVDKAQVVDARPEQVLAVLADQASELLHEGALAMLPVPGSPDTVVVVSEWERFGCTTSVVVRLSSADPHVVCSRDETLLISRSVRVEPHIAGSICSLALSQRLLPPDRPGSRFEWEARTRDRLTAYAVGWLANLNLVASGRRPMPAGDVTRIGDYTAPADVKKLHATSARRSFGVDAPSLWQAVTADFGAWPGDVPVAWTVPARPPSVGTLRLTAGRVDQRLFAQVDRYEVLVPESVVVWRSVNFAAAPIRRAEVTPAASGADLTITWHLRDKNSVSARILEETLDGVERRLGRHS